MGDFIWHHYLWGTTSVCVYLWCRRHHCFTRVHLSWLCVCLHSSAPRRDAIYLCFKVQIQPSHAAYLFHIYVRSILVVVHVQTILFFPFLLNLFGVECTRMRKNGTRPQLVSTQFRNDLRGIENRRCHKEATRKCTTRNTKRSEYHSEIGYFVRGFYFRCKFSLQCSIALLLLLLVRLLLMMTTTMIFLLIERSSPIENIRLNVRQLDFFFS